MGFVLSFLTMTLKLHFASGCPKTITTLSLNLDYSTPIEAVIFTEGRECAPSRCRRATNKEFHLSIAINKLKPVESDPQVSIFPLFFYYKFHSFLSVGSLERVALGKCSWPAEAPSLFSSRAIFFSPFVGIKRRDAFGLNGRPIEFQ